MGWQLWTRYPALQNAVLDQEDDNHKVIPGAWRDDANLEDMNTVGGSLATQAVKQQTLFEALLHFSSMSSSMI